jgi:hypothetical protein
MKRGKRMKQMKRMNSLSAITLTTWNLVTRQYRAKSKVGHAYPLIQLTFECILTRSIENEIRTSSPLSVVTTPPRYGIRQKEGLDVWFLKPGQRYFRHDKDSWPGERGRDFDIHTDRLEDQLAIEANALSPLNYDHEDKENDVTNFGSEETVSPTDGMTVMPATQYRSLFGDGDVQNHHPAVMNAFYATERMFTTYDLGGSDGANDADDRGLKSTLGAMDILASSDNLPRATNVQKARTVPDSVSGSSITIEADAECETASNTVEPDSVLG